jgi:hypothetical protein
MPVSGDDDASATAEDEAFEIEVGRRSFSWGKPEWQ